MEEQQQQQNQAKIMVNIKSTQPLDVCVSAMMRGDGFFVYSTKLDI